MQTQAKSGPIPALNNDSSQDRSRNSFLPKVPAQLPERTFTPLRLSAHPGFWFGGLFQSGGRAGRGRLCLAHSRAVNMATREFIRS